MRCDRQSTKLNRLADGELGWLSQWLLRRHVTHCPSCSGQFEEIAALRTALRTTLPFHRAPLALATRIGATVSREDPPAAPRRWRLPEAGFGLSGAIAGVALTLLVQVGLSERSADLAGHAAIEAHTAAMAAGHGIDIPTSDHHVVKPWLSARGDISPPVIDLTDEGFFLVGGRLDRVDGHRAAVVVYRRREHIIDLFASNAGNAPDSAPRSETWHGFNTVVWRQGGIDLVAVSDIAAKDLRTFAGGIRNAVGNHK
jgi:anti-sigma factor RsiW